MSYAVVGWSIALATLAIYAIVIVSRERRLAAAVPATRRRWLDAPDRTDA
jgi:hypothetical protein